MSADPITSWISLAAEGDAFRIASRAFSQPSFAMLDTKPGQRWLRIVHRIMESSLGTPLWAIDRTKALLSQIVRRCVGWCSLLAGAVPSVGWFPST